MKEKMDFESELNAETKQFLKTFERFIIKGFGKRCKTKGIGCHCCKIYAIYDLLKLFLI